MPRVGGGLIVEHVPGQLPCLASRPHDPPVDPYPLAHPRPANEALDFDRELTTVGVSSMLLGCTCGRLCRFHNARSSIGSRCRQRMH